MTTVETRDIAAPDLITTARYFINANHRPTASTPYFISIDHSPSEQLGYDSHTMALVVSHAMEHHELANELAKEIGCNKLRQWKNANDKYKQDFHHKFFHVLKKFPVLVIIIHGKENDILKYEPYFVTDIEAAGSYNKKIVDGKEIVEIGPVFENGSEEPQIFAISAKHATMAVFTVSCLIRVYDALQKAIAERDTAASQGFWIQIWSDRPPNNFDGRYAKAMGIFLGASRLSGKYTWGGFTANPGQSRDDQQINLLADNLAGLFNEICSGKKTYEYQGPPLAPPIIGAFILEKLS